MPGRPVEIFGHPIDDSSDLAQRDKRLHWCPFTNQECVKRSRLLDFPMGVCSVSIEGSSEIAICPQRFRVTGGPLWDIALAHFGSLENLVLLTEARLGNVGSLDFVIVRHRPLSFDVEDFAIVEVQADQTTGTGALVQAVQDFMGDKDIGNQNYRFGLNTYDTLKRAFTQILNKGVIVENWGRRIYWVFQQHTFTNLTRRYSLGPLPHYPEHSTVFAVYALRAGNLHNTGFHSATMDMLFHALRRPVHLLSEDKFKAYLTAKLQTGQARSIET